MGVKIIGAGVVSALGIGYDANLSALESHACGIGRKRFVETCLEFPVGEVKHPDAELQAMLGIEARKTVSRTALLGAMAAKEALCMANLPSGARVGLVSSTSVGGMDLTGRFYADFRKNPEKGRLRYVAGHDCASSTAFIAGYCGLDGFTATISTACSSAANAILFAARLLWKGILDYVLAGGTDALCAFTLNGFASLKILDSSLCRPMDRDRAGLNLGEGAGYVLMCRDESPGRPLARFLAGANANDAFHQTASSPGGDGASRAMEKALEKAGLAGGQIDYVNLHGTGTVNNDASESAALKRVFGEHVPAFSSTKSFTGHALAAAGGIEAVYSVMALREQLRFANLRFENKMDESPWEPCRTTSRGKVGHVLSNSFGFGGNCTTLIFGRA